MKTTVLLAILAVGAVVAVAGLAVASGPAASALGIGDRTGSQHGMMGQDGSHSGYGGCRGMDSGQYQYQNQYQYQQLNGTCWGQCSDPNDWNHSWDHGGMM